MFALGCGLLVVFMLRLTYRNFKRHPRKRNEPAIDAQPRPEKSLVENSWSGAHADSSARVERQKVELHEYSREVTAQIDNKLVMLSELIAKSERQIKRLEELLERTDSQ